MNNLILVLISLLFVSSCATRYILPANRFLGPEVQGGGFKTSIELQKSTAHNAKLKADNNGITGVKYEEISRMGYLLSTGLFDSFDIIWSHIGSGNSLVGGKYQFLGGDRTGTGTKLSVAYLVGGNEHESDKKDLEFTLNAQEFWGLYGLRINSFFMPYASLGYGKYNYKAHIKKGFFRGERPKIKSDIYFMMVGGEFNYEGFIFKLETGFQVLESSKTKDEWAYRTGFSLGYGW